MVENDPSEKGSDNESGDDSAMAGGRDLPDVSRRMLLGGTLAGIVGAVVPATAAADGGSFTAVADGDWSDPATWESGTVPTDGADVSIPSGVTVTVASRLSARLKYVEVAGTLRHAPDRDTRLRAETVHTMSGSRYEVGTSSTPVRGDVTAEVEFVDHGPIDESEWPDRKNKGLLAGGEVEVVGSAKTPWTALADHPTAGDTAIELPSEPTNWSAGDRVVLPGTGYYTSTDLSHEDEERTVASVDGTTVTFDTPLDYDHAPPKAGLDAYALNLSRNVVFASENTDEHRRGHVMIMSTGSEVRWVRFDELGRTNKDEPITDPVRNADEVSADDPNPAARYALHWHRTGIDASDPHEVEGVVVDGTPGWGVVNHHAYAHVTDSISYRVSGAGFVAEGGNERGSFERNFALRSSGSGERIDARAAGKAGGDPPIDDFGHAGHGFWIQSPIVEVADNVAAGHRHYAYVVWTRPLLDGPMAECTSVEDSRVNHCPNLPMEYVDQDRPLLEAIEAERFSDHDQLMKDTGKIPSEFARVRRFEGNEAFGAAGGLDFSRNQFKWEHQRFSDFSVIDDFTVYGVGPHVEDDGTLDGLSDPIERHRGGKLGGNMAVQLRYTSNVTIRNSLLLGDGDGLAVPFHDYLWTNVIEDSTIENWAWGVAPGEHRLTWIRNNTFAGNDVDVDWSIESNGNVVLDDNDLDTVRYELEYFDVKADELFYFHRSKGTRIDGRTVYWSEAAADYVPVENAGAIDQMDRVFDDPSATEGLTNQELQDQFGVSVGGALLDSDVVSEPFVDGGYLDPATEENPPASVYVDAADAETTGSFEVVSEPDAAGDRCLRATGSGAPKDDPASLTFECAAGTYTLHGRVWPDAWNGDTVSYRIDGGTWRDAEKMKSPVSFDWHDASPNGGDAYTWDLEEGTHTLEIACGNDDVRIDEIFLGTGEELLAAYGMSADSGPVLDVATDPATAVGETSATLHGSVDDLGGADAADCHFEYRQVGASSWTATSTQSLSSTGAFSADVTGLADGADYEYRAVADASDGDAATGSTVTFTTTADVLAATTDAASDVGTGSATLNGSLDDLGGADLADCHFEYRQVGASAWDATSAQSLFATGSFDAAVSGLASGADYEYRVVVEAADGDAATGGTVTFTTVDGAPSATTDSATGVGSEDATLNGTLDGLGGADAADCYFEYREDGASSWTATSAQSLSSTGAFSADVSGLSAATDHECRAVVEASDGETATGDTVAFTTAADAAYVDHDLSHIQAEDFDTGGEGVAYSDTSDGNYGGSYRATNVDIQEADDVDGGYNVGWIEPGEWWEYTVEVPERGDYPLQARVAGMNDTSLDVAVDGEQVATVDVPDTGGWQDWTTVESDVVTLPAGTHTIRLTANGGSFNLNWFGFEGARDQSAYADHDLSRVQAEDFDTGGEGVAYEDVADGNAGGAYRATNVDIQVADDVDGGYNVGWIEPGEWLEYTVEVPADGDYSLVSRLAGYNDTTLDVAVDGEQVATVDVPDTGGWQDWTTVDSGTVPLSAGTHTVRVTANGGSFNFNWFGFE
jgi:hypothetical protein